MVNRDNYKDVFDYLYKKTANRAARQGVALYLVTLLIKKSKQYYSENLEEPVKKVIDEILRLDAAFDFIKEVAKIEQ